jgi:hypothetical protein
MRTQSTSDSSVKSDKRDSCVQLCFDMCESGEERVEDHFIACDRCSPVAIGDRIDEQKSFAGTQVLFAHR